MMTPAAPPTRHVQSSPARSARRRLRTFALASAAIVLAAFTGGALWLRANAVEVGLHMLIDAPNRGRAIAAAGDLGETDRRALGVTAAFRVEVDPPASLSVWVVDPPPEHGGEPIGTVLYLHGIGDRKETMLSTAVSHAARGYRGVLVDSRGHGRSSGEWATFGLLEVADCRRILDELQRRGLLAGRVAVYGASFGGGVAVQLAARDERIATAIVLAPFRSLEAIARARVQSLGLAWLFDGPAIEQVLARVALVTGREPATADGVAALQEASAGGRPVPLLIFHGDRDEVIPPEHSAALLAVADPRSRRLVIPGATHYDWTPAGNAALWTETTAWLDRWLRDAK